MNESLAQLLKMGAHQLDGLSVNRVDAVANPATRLPFAVLKETQPPQTPPAQNGQVTAAASEAASTIAAGVRGVLKAIAAEGDGNRFGKETAEALTELAKACGASELVFKAYTAPMPEAKAEECESGGKKMTVDKKTKADGDEKKEGDAADPAEAIAEKVLDTVMPTIMKALEVAGIKLKAVDEESPDPDEDEEGEEGEEDPAPKRKTKLAKSAQPEETGRVLKKSATKVSWVNAILG